MFGLVYSPLGQSPFVTHLTCERVCECLLWRVTHIVPWQVRRACIRLVAGLVSDVEEAEPVTRKASQALALTVPAWAINRWQQGGSHGNTREVFRASGVQPRPLSEHAGLAISSANKVYAQNGWVPVNAQVVSQVPRSGGAKGGKGSDIDDRALPSCSA
jgi:hypothetical protein